MNITEFAEKHGNPCDEWRQWLRENNLTDMREIWLRDDLRPDWRVWIVTKPGVLSDKDARLFAVWCARQVQHLMNDQRSIDALDVAEKYANDEATDEDLAAAGDPAWAAARAAAIDATWASAWAAARAAAWAAARATRAAVRDAASAAAWAAIREAWGASAEDWVAAKDAARKRQADECLRRWPNLFVEENNNNQPKG